MPYLDVEQFHHAWPDMSHYSHITWTEYRSLDMFLDSWIIFTIYNFLVFYVTIFTNAAQLWCLVILSRYEEPSLLWDWVWSNDCYVALAVSSLPPSLSRPIVFMRRSLHCCKRIWGRTCSIHGMEIKRERELEERGIHVFKRQQFSICWNKTCFD